MLEAVAELKANGGKGIIGGGDSATAAAKWDMEDKVPYTLTLTLTLISPFHPNPHPHPHPNSNHR